MAVSLPRCRHKKSPELSRMAPHPRGAGTERHVYRHDPRGDRNGTISTSNAIRATNNDPTAHGEMVAIRQFVAERPTAELEGATIYTSGEPCPMCMSAILWCRFSRVVYAASIDELA